MNRVVSFTVGISTNPTFSERYFCDLRCGARQTVRYRDAAGVAEFLNTARKIGKEINVEVVFIDETGELSDLN